MKKRRGGKSSALTLTLYPLITLARFYKTKDSTYFGFRFGNISGLGIILFSALYNQGAY